MHRFKYFIQTEALKHACTHVRMFMKEVFIICHTITKEYEFNHMHVFKLMNMSEFETNNAIHIFQYKLSILQPPHLIFKKSKDSRIHLW